MGALLSIPLMAVPSMGTVRHFFPRSRTATNARCRSSLSLQAVAEPLPAPQYAVLVVNVVIGLCTLIVRLTSLLIVCLVLLRVSHTLSSS